MDFPTLENIQNTSFSKHPWFFDFATLPTLLRGFSVEMFFFQQVMAIVSANCRASVVVAFGKDPHQAETFLLGRSIPLGPYHNIYHVF